VTLAYLAGEVQVSVVDDGRGDASSGGDPGHGLVGMRERVLLQGGSLRAGPRTGGGFAVQATLPLADPARIRAQQ
jgi:signal transduction histidine kinase